MKTSCIAITLALAFPSFAVPGAQKASPASAVGGEQIAARRAAQIAMEGGIMEVGGKGRVAVVLAPGVPADAIKEEALRFGKTIHVDMAVSVGGFTLGGRAKAFKAADANAVVFFAEESTLPMSLVALEERWAFVNVARLKADNPTAEVFALRARKMLLRAFFNVLGSGCSKYPANPLKPISSLGELDKLPEPLLTIDSAIGMYGYLPGLGLERYETMTYKEACEEDLAPAPTNDVQRAIWERVKADKERGPSNPIKIEPPKKAKGEK